MLVGVLDVKNPSFSPSRGPLLRQAPESTNCLICSEGIPLRLDFVYTALPENTKLERAKQSNNKENERSVLTASKPLVGVNPQRPPALVAPRFFFFICTTSIWTWSRAKRGRNGGTRSTKQVAQRRTAKKGEKLRSKETTRNRFLPEGEGRAT